MKTIWNLLDEQISLTNVIDYQIIPVAEGSCDVLICGLEHIEYAGILVNPRETFIIVALENSESERHLIPNTFSAWIDRKRVAEFYDMLNAYRSHIDEKIKFRETRNLLEQLVVDTSVHQSNLDVIRATMRSSTKEIETIFEERVEEMREIHRDTSSTLDHLSRLKEQIVPEVFENLEESWEMTRSILGRTDEVIKAMFGFVMVLQCEDRISQMIDGIENIMRNDIDSAINNGFVIAEEQEKILKERLVPFYTIQDQRDYAVGINIPSQGCKPDQVDIDDFILF